MVKYSPRIRFNRRCISCASKSPKVLIISRTRRGAGDFFLENLIRFSKFSTRDRRSIENLGRVIYWAEFSSARGLPHPHSQLFASLLFTLHLKRFRFSFYFTSSFFFFLFLVEAYLQLILLLRLFLLYLCTVPTTAFVCYFWPTLIAAVVEWNFSESQWEGNVKIYGLRTRR